MRGELLGVVVLLMAACGPAAQPVPTGTLPDDSETIPDDVLDESDPHADTSDNPILSSSGCGGLFNPCPDINRPRGGCMGCPPAVGDRGAFPAPAAAPFFLLLLWIRRRRR